MTFIKQTTPDSDNNYTITWRDQDGHTHVTEHNLLDW